jgi:hypothetical protein
VISAGFVDFAITWRAEVYAGAPQSSSADEFGALGITFRARKATTEQEWQGALAALQCEVPRPEHAQPFERRARAALPVHLLRGCG